MFKSPKLMTGAAIVVAAYAISVAVRAETAAPTPAPASFPDKPWTQTAATGKGDPATVTSRRFASVGTEASSALIAAWDIDIRPDGAGLPEGRGSVDEGEEVYATQCAHCHGDFGYGISGYPPLVGGSAEDLDVQPVRGGPEKTVGSYWPYASTLWDYIHRAMPFGNAQSLSADQTYALTAYILYMNGIVEGDAELTRDTLAAVDMPNADGFVMDPRPDVIGTLCMENCRDTDPEITSNAKSVAVTPEGDEAVR